MEHTDHTCVRRYLSVYLLKHYFPTAYRKSVLHIYFIKDIFP